ncbi:MAG: hypothetical protein EOP04_14950 [Proteobacteria bacterium]|nr:MAG: hypothetical protein EOP04_14950 [Pseudomonadota bacterium]
MAAVSNIATGYGYVLQNSPGTTPNVGQSGFAGTHSHTISITGGVLNSSVNTSSTGGSETAPRHVTENAFIKINREYLRPETALLIFRIPQDVRINDVLVSPVGQGVSGSLTVDIQKGATPSSATQSIFQSGQLPTLTWNSATGVTGLLDSNQNELEAGQFIVVRVTTTQAKLKAFHLYIAGDL